MTEVQRAENFKKSPTAKAPKRKVKPTQSKTGAGANEETRAKRQVAATNNPAYGLEAQINAGVGQTPKMTRSSPSASAAAREVHTVQHQERIK